jgi:hypothetical protein
MGDRMTGNENLFDKLDDWLDTLDDDWLVNFERYIGQWLVVKIDIAVIILAIGLAIWSRNVGTFVMLGLMLSAFNIAVATTMWNYGFWYRHGFGKNQGD